MHNNFSQTFCSNRGHMLLRIVVQKNKKPGLNLCDGPWHLCRKESPKAFSKKKKRISKWSKWHTRCPEVHRSDRVGEEPEATRCLSCHRQVMSDGSAPSQGLCLPPSFSRLNFHMVFQVKRKKTSCLWLCFIFLSQNVALKAACMDDPWTPFSCNSAATFSPCFQKQHWKKNGKKPLKPNQKFIYRYLLSSTFRECFFPHKSKCLLYRLQSPL